MRGLKLVWPTCGMGKEGGGIGHQHVRGQGEYGGDGESVGTGSRWACTAPPPPTSITRREGGTHTCAGEGRDTPSSNSAKATER